MLDKILHKYEEIRRESDKIRAPFLLLYYFAHRAAENVYMRIIKAFFPVDNHRIILRSFPDYSDNARALAEYLLANGYDSRYTIFFDVSDLRGCKNRKVGLTFISCETKLVSVPVAEGRLYGEIPYVYASTDPDPRSCEERAGPGQSVSRERI